VAIELDDLDKDFLARSHTQDEWRRECESALKRCAWYAARITELEAEVTRLRGDQAACGYPGCMSSEGRCERMFKGECAGPRK
jgi:hypothetical protein